MSVGDTCNRDNGSASGHARVFSYSSTANKWNIVGSAIPGAVSEDYFGYSVSISSDGMTVAVGAMHDDDNGHHSGHARLFACSSTTKEWNIVGLTIPGAASRDEFGH